VVCILIVSRQIDLTKGEKMATKRQIEANRRNSDKSTGPGDTTKTKHNATKHSLYSAGITNLDKAEGFEELLASLVAEHNPVGILENYRVYCIARDIIRGIRTHRLESQFLETVLQPEFHDSHADDNSASAPKTPTVKFRVTSQVAPSVLEIVVTKYHRCEAFYANDCFRSERDLERLQRTRNGDHLPAPAERAVTVHSATKTVESLPNVKDSNTCASPWPATISNGSGAAKDSDPNTDEHAGHVSVPVQPDARRTELARIGEEDSARVSPLPEAEISLVSGATQDSRRDTELCGTKATGDLGLVAGLQDVLSQQKPCPNALWQKTSGAPLWMQENETKPKS
jgi:hypothetical protein